MTLRNVPKAHTLEQQRQEINLIASDLNTAVDGVKTFGGDKTFTGDITFSDSGSASFGDDADLKIYYDGSVGVLTSFIESDALQIRSATDTSELYATFLKDGPVELYYDGTKRFGTNATGATVLGDLNVSSNLTFDTAGSHIEFTPSSWSGSAPYMEFWVGNDSGTHYAQIDGGNAGQLQIMNTGHPNGHLDLRTAKDFSVDCGGYYAILAQATGATKIWHPVSQENILNPKFETTATGAKVNGFFESSLLVNTNNTPTAGEGIEMFYDSAASGGAAGSIQAYDRDGAALTRLKIRSSNWEIDNDGTGTFGGDISIQDSSYLRVRATGDNASTAVQLGPDGTGSFASGALSISNVGVTTVDLAGGNSGWAFYASNNDSRTGRPTFKATNKAGGELFGGTNADASANVFAIQSDGSSTFAGDAAFGTGASDSRITLGSHGTAGTNDSVHVRADSANLLFMSGNGGITKFEQNGTTRLTINADGSSTFSNTVKAEQTSNNALSAFEAVDTNGTRFKVTGAGVLSIYDNTLTEKVTISSDGSITFNDQELSSTYSSGNGVSVTATGLDHYEQGTFAPYFGFGITSATYAFNAGDYIRIGNVVHFYITISATGTNTGDAIQILGLPYPAAGTDGGSASFSYNTGWVANGDTMPNTYISNAGRILFYDPGTGNSWNGLSGNGLSGAVMYIGGHYICA